VGGIDVFISHVEEDETVALELADALDAAGYATWCYERDTIPGPSYLLQTSRAISESRTVVVLISPDSLGSHQVTSEVVRAHEEERPFIPLLIGISREEFGVRQPEWREAIGSAATVELPPGGVQGVVPRIVEGLTALGIRPHEPGGPRPKLSYVGEGREFTSPAAGLRRRPGARLLIAAGVVALLVIGTAVAVVATRGTEEQPGSSPSTPTSPSATVPTSPAPGTTAVLPSKDAATTALKTEGGLARATARTDTRYCPIGGGTCQDANPGRVFLFVDLAPWNGEVLTYDNPVSMSAFSARVSYAGVTYSSNENHSSDLGGAGFTLVFPGVPDSVAGTDVELRWPGNPALRLHVKG
jgi:hypothetical protein